MLSSIHPAVRGAVMFRRRTWLGIALMHSIGTSMVAAAMGASLVAAGTILRQSASQPSWLPATMAVMALIYIPRELGWTVLPPLIQSTWQVPPHWAHRYPPAVSALMYGAGLGTGFATRLGVPTFYALLLFPLVVPGITGVIAWWVYGIVRSLGVWFVASTSPLDEPLRGPSAWMEAGIRRAPAIHRGQAILLLAITVWAGLKVGHA